MDKLTRKASATALQAVQEALEHLNECKSNIQQGLTAQTYADKAKNQLARAIDSMQDAAEWMEALSQPDSKGDKNA